MKDSEHDKLGGCLLRDNKKSVISERLLRPGKLLIKPSSPVLRLHRKMKSDVSIHEIVKLAIQIKRGDHDLLIKTIIPVNFDQFL